MPEQPQPTPHGNAGALRRNYLSGIENFAQSIGTMGPVATIGTLLPILIYKSGNGTWLMFVGVALAFSLISSNITVFASRFASAGSLSAYTEESLGPVGGNLAGWSYAVAMFFVVTSSAVSCAFYVDMVIGHFTHAALHPMASLLVTVSVVVLAWWPAHHDIKLSTKIMLTAEILSAALILTILVVAMASSHAWVDVHQLRLEGVGGDQVRAGFVLAFMTLAGFESAASLGEEASSATRTLPRVMLSCILPVGILFLLSIYCLTALSHSRDLALDQTDAPIDLIAQAIGHPTLGWLSSLGVATSCFGCALGGFNAGSRMLFSMARGGRIPARLSAVHPRNGTPHLSLALLAVFAGAVPCAMLVAGVSMSDQMDYLMQIASFGFLGAYFLVCAAAPRFLAREHVLTPRAAVASILSLAIIGTVFVMSVFPVPSGPWKYLPYVFGILVAAGMLITWGSRRRSPAPRISPDPVPSRT